MSFNPINELDHSVSQGILRTAETLRDLNPILWAIEYFKLLPVNEQKEVQMPSPIDWVKNKGNALAYYHGQVFRETSHWSHEISNGITWTAEQILHPLSFCKIGRAIKHSLSHNIVGNIAQTVAFCALQIFHLIPYVFASSIAGGLALLYRADPIALTALFTGGMLLTQIWFIFRLVKTVDATRESFEQKADELMEKINLVQIAKNTVWSVFSQCAKFGYWTVSWFPMKRRYTKLN